MFAFQQSGVTAFGDFPFLQHLAYDHFDMLVVNFNTLQTIHILHLIDHVICQRFNAHNGQNIMRGWVAIHDVIALLHKITLGNRNMLSFRNHIFHQLQRFIGRLNADPSLVFIIAPKAHISIDFRDNRVIFWTACLKQFSNPRQTTCDVFCFGPFTRNTCDHIPRFHLLTIFDRQDRINRHWIGNWIARLIAHRLTIFTGKDNFRLQFAALCGGAPVNNDFLRHPGCIIGFFTHGNAIGQVHMFGNTGFFGDDRQSIGIPLK